MGEKFNGYKTGRFEAMQSTRNALTGDKRRLDLLSRMKANPKEKPLVFNSQDQDTIDQVKSAEANRDRRQLDKLIKTHNELSQKYMLDTILADRAMEMAPKIWKAVDHRLNQEAQKKIQEKIEARVAAAQAKKEQEKQAKPLSEFEMTMMVWKLLAEAQNKALKKTTEEVALFIIDRLPGPVYRALSVLGVISLVLAACASFTPNPEFNPAGDNNTPSGEMTDLPEETSEPVGEPTSLPEAEPTADPLLIKVETGLGSNPNSQTSYVRALEIHNNESMVQACLDFVKRLDNRIDINYNTIGINQYGICYAKSDDGSQIIFDKWDANGPLYVTRAAGFDLLSKLNPQATDGKTEEDFSLEENAANTFAVLKDDQGNLTEVGVGIDGQWGTTGSTELVATPTAPSENSETDLEEGNLLTSNPEVIASMASDVLSGKTEFPSDVNPEQYSALVKEMNAQRGSKPVYVEAVDASGNPTVMFYNTETRKFETLKGTYEDNKEIIDQHGFDIYVEIGQNEQGLTTYTHPDTGEEIIVENSGGIDWDWVGDKNNAGENISQEALASQILGLVLDKGYSAIQVITINKDPAEMVFAQGKYFGYNCVEVLVVRNGVGIRAFVGANGDLVLVDGNTGKEKALGRLNGTSERKSIKENMVYYVFIPKNQADMWLTSRQDIDQLENVIEPTDSYSELVDGYSTDGIVIIRSSAIVLRTNK